MTTPDISINVEAVQGEVAKFDQLAAGLAALEEAHPKDVVYPVATALGMEQAIVARRAWREPRIALEKARKAAKAPILALGRSIDSFAGELEVKLLEGEKHYDDQIKAEEARKEAIRQAKLQEIAAAQAALREQIAHTFSRPALALRSAPAEAIAAALSQMEATGLEPFGDLAPDAADAKAEAVAMLRVDLAAAQAREEQEAALERQRQEQAAQREQLERDRAALAEREAAVQAQETAARAERDRQEAAGRAAAEQAEAERLAAERTRHEAAESVEAAERAAAARVERAAPAMLHALQQWMLADQIVGAGSVQALEAACRLRTEALAQAMDT